MKKFLLLAGVACLFSANAQAEVSQYVSAKLSYDFNKVNVKESSADADVAHAKLDKELFGTHVAYGVRAGYVRGEIELNNSRDIKRNNVVDEYSVEHFRLYKHSVMANAYFDYLTCTAWTPYVGAGLGTSYLKADFGDVAKSANNLAWQVMAGVTYDVNANWALDLGYRYADLGRVRKNFGGEHKVKVDARDHEVLFGVRYTF
jgi:opacity protein-like surface antigen